MLDAYNIRLKDYMNKDKKIDQDYQKNFITRDIFDQLLRMLERKKRINYILKYSLKQEEILCQDQEQKKI